MVRLRLFAAAREAAGRAADDVRPGAEPHARRAPPRRRDAALRRRIRRRCCATARVWVNGDEPDAGTGAPSCATATRSQCCRRSAAVPDPARGSGLRSARVCYRSLRSCGSCLYVRRGAAPSSCRSRLRCSCCRPKRSVRLATLWPRPKRASPRPAKPRTRPPRAYEDAQTTLLHAPGRHRPDEAAGRRAPEERRRAAARSPPPRALEAYKGGNADLDAIMDGADVLEAMRRSELLDRRQRAGQRRGRPARRDDRGPARCKRPTLDHEARTSRPTSSRASKRREADDAPRRSRPRKQAEQQLKARLAREQRETRAAGPPAEGARRGRGERRAKKGSGGRAPAPASPIVVGRWVPVPGPRVVVQRLVRRARAPAVAATRAST